MDTKFEDLFYDFTHEYNIKIGDLIDHAVGTALYNPDYKPDDVKEVLDDVMRFREELNEINWSPEKVTNVAEQNFRKNIDFLFNINYFRAELDELSHRIESREAYLRPKLDNVFKNALESWFNNEHVKNELKPILEKATTVDEFIDYIKSTDVRYSNLRNRSLFYRRDSTRIIVEKKLAEAKLAKDNSINNSKSSNLNTADMSATAQTTTQKEKTNLKTETPSLDNGKKEGKKLKSNSKSKKNVASPNGPSLPSQDPLEASKQAAKSVLDTTNTILKVLITPNNEKITHIHAFQSNKNENDWFLSARKDGVPLKPQKLSDEDAKAYQERNYDAHELAKKYYPSSFKQKASEKDFQLPLAVEFNGQSYQVTRFWPYKEKNPQSPDVNKWKFFAEIDGKKMSVVADRNTLTEYFDRTAPLKNIIETSFKSKLDLKDNYNLYKLPDGVTADNVKVFPDPKTKKWGVQVYLKDYGKFHAQLSQQDGFALFGSKTATKEQLAAKYLGNDIAKALTEGPKLSNSNSLKR